MSSGVDLEVVAPVPVPGANPMMSGHGAAVTLVASKHPDLLPARGHPVGGEQEASHSAQA